MPTLEDSQFDRSQTTPAHAAEAGTASLIPQATAQMSPFMHCAMPVMASTYDSLARQFYGNDRIPHIRILPPGGGQ